MPALDPLSDVLALLKPRTYLSAGLKAGGDWSLAYPAFRGIKFNAVLQGSCWVAAENTPPCKLAEGDCFLLTSGRPFVLASDLALPPIPALSVYTAAPEECLACVNDGSSFSLVGGRFIFAADHAEAHGNALFGSLPAVVPVRTSSDGAPVLRWALDLFAAELREREPGASLLADHLAHIMLVQVLRSYLHAGEPAGTGWFSALADPRLCAALTAMHAAIARRWTLEELARIAGMSRSTFAERFMAVVGTSPIEYLTSWRMRVAEDRLRTTENTIAAIANAVGYESQAAFSTAFKKRTGSAPRDHRRTPKLTLKP